MKENEGQDSKRKKGIVILAVSAAALLIFMTIIVVAVIMLIVKGRQETNELLSTQEQTITGETSTDVDKNDLADDKNPSTELSEETSSSEPDDGKTGAVISTGNLSENGSGYEGVEGIGKHNYGEALQKSLLFYELQRSGDLPEESRCNWRGDSGMKDGSDVGLDLTGGLYDAGDHVKFNLPMAYTSAILGWSIYEDRAAYEESGQLTYALGNIKWINDYLIKCHPEDEVFYYQVGNGSADHSWWGPAEVMQMERPSYCVTKQNPGSAVVAEAAAALAVGNLIFAEEDPEYSQTCLEHAKSLYSFAVSTKSDAGYTMANGFYNSHSGFYDELAWAGTWLYLATGEQSYLSDAENFYQNANQDYDWALCWDDVHIGAAVLLSRITKKDTYTKAVEQHLDFWTDGTAGGERITYSPKGLAWLDSWGSLRYSTTTAFVASVYSEWTECPAQKKTVYWDFAVAQAGYALGDTGFSYQIGYGEQYPQNPHHRTAQGSYCNNMNEPAVARHTLYGALVGGPDASDGYTDVVSNYNTNEVACDYNAGFTGLLANLYSVYHGKTLKDFGAVEVADVDEIYADAGINVDGSDFIEIKAYVYNQSAWPARQPKNLELRYYVDLSECIEAGASASDIEVTTNYMQAGNAAGLKVWDEDKNLYYLSVDFSGADIYPGGQDAYKKEIQVRLRNPKGVWDNSNDPSYEGLQKGSVSLATKLGLYEDGVLIFGSEPASGSQAGKSVVTGSGSSGNSQGGSSGSNQGSSPSGSQGGSSGNGQGSSSGSSQGGSSGSGTGGSVSQKQSAENDTCIVNVDYAGMQSSSTSLSGTLTFTNNGSESISTNDIEISFFFSKDRKQTLNFACYHAAVNTKSGDYQALSGATGTFEDFTGTDADTVCRMKFSDAKKIANGDTLTINFSINRSDWSAFTTTNDYSLKQAENIVIRDGSTIIFGTEP